MKVAHVIAEMRTGGAQAVVAALAEDAVDRGDDVLVASAGGWHAERLAALGVHTATVGLDVRNPARLAVATGALRRSLRAFAPDLVHAHNVKAGLAARVAAGRRTPLVVTLHGVADADYPAAARILKRCADTAVAVSADVGERLCAAAFPRSRLIVIPNAVTAPDLPPRSAARRELDLPPGVPVALCAARLVPQKRHDLLVEAWRGVPEPAVLLIAGDGPNRAAVQAAVERTGLAGRVRVLGDRADVPRLLAAADLFVLATDWEGLPISVLEALAARVPVVASGVGGLRAVAAASELVEPGSAAALTAGICRVLADPARRSALVAAGSDLIEGRYAPHTMLAGYRAAYDALGGERPARTLERT